MANPSWLPTWPSTWLDFEASYRALMPGSLPGGLFSPDSEPYADWKAIGVAFAQIRKIIEWILRSYHPYRDTNGLQLGRWESLFQLGNRGAAALRAAWTTAMMRQRGIMNEDLAKAIMAGAWDDTDGSFLSVHHCDPVTAATYGAQPTDDLTRREQQHLHFYPTAEDVEPDYDQAADLYEKAKATYSRWSVGKKRYFEYGDATCGWGMACWNG